MKNYTIQRQDLAGFATWAPRRRRGLLALPGFGFDGAGAAEARVDVAVATDGFAEAEEEAEEEDGAVDDDDAAEEAETKRGAEAETAWVGEEG